MQKTKSTIKYVFVVIMLCVMLFLCCSCAEISNITIVNDNGTVDRFCTYFLTFSGHMQYNFNTNNVARRNKAISDTYEPGSTFKPLLVAAAFEEGLINQGTTFTCQGGLQVADKYIGCMSHHGTLTAQQVLQKSCNVGVMEIAQKLTLQLFFSLKSLLGVSAFQRFSQNPEGHFFLPTHYIYYNIYIYNYFVIGGNRGYANFTETLETLKRLQKITLENQHIAKFKKI